MKTVSALLRFDCKKCFPFYFCMLPLICFFSAAMNYEHEYYQWWLDANNRIAAHNAQVEEFKHEWTTALAIISCAQKKRKCVRKLFSNRNADGAGRLHISRCLIDDDTKFMEYFRVTPDLFSTILGMTKDGYEKSATNFNRRPISANDKLCLTLR